MYGMPWHACGYFSERKNCTEHDCSIALNIGHEVTSLLARVTTLLRREHWTRWWIIFSERLNASLAQKWQKTLVVRVFRRFFGFFSGLTLFLRQNLDTILCGTSKRTNNQIFGTCTTNLRSVASWKNSKNGLFLTQKSVFWKFDRVNSVWSSWNQSKSILRSKIRLETCPVKLLHVEQKMPVRASTIKP